jgi:hypothetical protein
LLILLILLSSLLHAQGSWHPEKTYWPRTLIDSSQTAINEVKARVIVAPFLSIYNDIKTKSDVEYYTCTTELQKAVVARCAAFRFFIDDVTTYGDKAKEYLIVMQRESYSNLEEQYKNILWDSEMLSLACIAYDFLKGIAMTLLEMKQQFVQKFRILLLICIMILFRVLHGRDCIFCGIWVLVNR